MSGPYSDPIETKSKVLQEREQLETTLQDLQSLIRANVAKMDPAALLPRGEATTYGSRVVCVHVSVRPSVSLSTRFSTRRHRIRC